MAGKVAARVELVVFLTVFLDLVGFGIVIPLFPFYVQSMGGTAQTVGVLLSSFAATQLLATPILGRLSDRHGRRPVILLSLVGNALSLLAFAAATRLAWLPLLFASRILAGATAGNLAACQAAVADVTEGEARTRGMGRVGAGIGLGLVVGPILGGQLARFGAWVPPAGAAGLAAFDLVLAAVLMPETRVAAPRPAPAAERRPQASLGRVLAEPRVLAVLAIYFLTFLCMTNLQVALALLTKQRLGWGEKETGHVFGLFGLVMLVVQGVLIGRLSRRFGPMNVVTTGAVLTAVGLAGIGASHAAVPLIASCLFMALGTGVTNPVLSAVASEYAGAEQRGAVLGVAQSAGGLARAVGPVWAGFLFARVGAGAPFFFGAAAASVAATVAVLLRALAGRAGQRA